MEKYRVTYMSGGGTEYKDGVWKVKQTPKTITAEKIEEDGVGIYSMHEVGFKTRIGKGTGNPIKYEEENGFTVYFWQAGTPYIFEKIS